MDDGTKKELRDIGNMVINWTRGYTRQLDPHGGNEYLIHDFSEEINTNIVPYMTRLQECEHLTGQELSQFRAIIGSHIAGFMELINELEE